jgi:hypothetical protein
MGTTNNIPSETTNGFAFEQKSSSIFAMGLATLQNEASSSRKDSLSLMNSLSHSGRVISSGLAAEATGFFTSGWTRNGIS